MFPRLLSVSVVVVHKFVRKHRCTLYLLTLLVRWDGSSTLSERDHAQDRRVNMLGEARGWITANFQNIEYYYTYSILPDPGGRGSKRSCDLQLSVEYAHHLH